MNIKFKKIFCGLFAGLCILGLSACGNSDSVDETSKPTLPVEIELKEPQKPDDFYIEFNNYLQQNQFKNKNYTVSPVLFRYSMFPIVNGASGETQSELLTALGFNSLNEYKKWYQETTELSNTYTFDEQTDEIKTNLKDIKTPCIYYLKNAMWENKTLYSPFFMEGYKNTMEVEYGVDFNSLNQSDMVSDINTYMSNNTKKQVPEFFPSDFDMSKCPYYVASSLYFRSPWEYSFLYDESFDGDFVSSNGEIVQKEYIKLSKKLQYFNDGNSELVSVPLKNGMNVAFLIGDNKDFISNIRNSILQSVSLSVPKSDISTHINGSIFNEYLKSRDVEEAFSASADFSKISPHPFHFTAFDQEVLFRMSENGISTTSKNATVITNNSNPDKILTLDINRDYYFYVYSEIDDNIDIIYSGHVCN